MDADSKVNSLLPKEDNVLNLSMALFYDIYADTKVRLEDGEIVKLNKSMLCFTARSKILYQVFYGYAKGEVLDIKDINSETFKLFLDLIMSFKLYTFENAFKIFPVAWKYQMDEVINKCIEIFTSTDLSNTQFYELFNMAVFYSCERLIKSLCNKFKNFSEYECKKILLDKEFCSALQPDSLKILLSKISKFDYFLLLSVMRWGSNYLQINQTGFTLRDFMQKNDLLKYFKLEYLDSFEIYDFMLEKGGESLISLEKALRRLRDVTFSEYTVKIFEKEEHFTDEVIMAGLPIAGVPYGIKYNITLEPIEIKFYQGMEPYDESETLMTCTGEYSGREHACNDHEIFYKSELAISSRMLKTSSNIQFQLDFKKINMQVVGAKFKFDRKFTFKWVFLWPCSVTYKSDLKNFKFVKDIEDIGTFQMN